MQLKFACLFLFVLLTTAVKKCKRIKGGVNSNITSDFIHDGYMKKISYNPGDTAQVFINANLGFHTQSKLYLYSVNHLSVDSVNVDLAPQSIRDSTPWKNGFGYSPSFNYVI